MSFRPQRDKPLPKGLVHGITSIMFESALEPAKPPKAPSKSNADHASSVSTNHKEEKDEQEAK